LSAKEDSLRWLMNTDKISVFEAISIILYVVVSLSTLVYFLHTLVVVFYSQAADFAAQVEPFL
jgi:hypothetical protein